MDYRFDYENGYTAGYEEGYRDGESSCSFNYEIDISDSSRKIEMSINKLKHKLKVIFEDYNILNTQEADDIFYYLENNII